MAIDKIIIGSNRQSSLTAGVPENNFVRVQDLNGVVDDANTDIAANTASITALTSAVAADITVAEVEIDATTLKQMNTGTKPTLIAGVAGTAIEVVGATLVLDHGGTNFAGGGTLFFQTDDGEDVLNTTVPASFINSAADAIRVVGRDGIASYVFLNGEGIVLGNATGDFTTGDGVLRVFISYRRHTTGL